MSELRESVSGALKQAITSSGMTYVAIADLVGVSRAMISGYMRGNRRLSMEKELKLLEHFGYKFEIGESDATTA